MPRSFARSTALSSLLAAALLAACTSGGDEPASTASPTEPASPTGTPTEATAAPKPTREPTAAPQPEPPATAPQRMRDVSTILTPFDRIERVAFAAGENPGGDHGVFYTDVATGVTELWRLVGFDDERSLIQ